MKHTRRNEKGQFIKKYNKYNLSNDYGIGYDCNNKEFYFDLEDYDLIKNYSWFVKANGYVTSRIRYNKKQREIKIHRFIMNCNFGDKKIIDHKNGMKNDNRKCNLRFANKYSNRQNVIHRPNSTSGITGITFDKEKQKWRSRITVKRNVIHLGYFEDLKDAKMVRLDAQEKYFKDFNPEKRKLFNTIKQHDIE